MAFFIRHCFSNHWILVSAYMILLLGSQVILIWCIRSENKYLMLCISCLLLFFTFFGFIFTVDLTKFNFSLFIYVRHICNHEVNCQQTLCENLITTQSKYMYMHVKQYTQRTCMSFKKKINTHCKVDCFQENKVSCCRMY